MFAWILELLACIFETLLSLYNMLWKTKTTIKETKKRAIVSIVPHLGCFFSFVITGVMEKTVKSDQGN